MLDLSFSYEHLQCLQFTKIKANILEMEKVVFFRQYSLSVAELIDKNNMTSIGLAGYWPSPEWKVPVSLTVLLLCNETSR